MKQSCFMSLAESIANVAVGYCVAVLTQLIVFPWFWITNDSRLSVIPIMK
jgi:hypothetical protein